MCFRQNIFTNEVILGLPYKPESKAVNVAETQFLSS